MPETQTRGEAVAKIAKLIKGVRIAMFTTIEEEGHLHSRPMALQEVEFDGDIWFFTNHSAPKVHQIEHEPRVNVAFSDPEHQVYVSLSGRASLVLDKAKNHELWNPSLNAWFPGGVDDPDLALLKVSVDGAEYWDSPSTVVAHVAGFIKSKLSGEQANVGDHAKVEI